MRDIIWGMPTLIELDDIEANVNLCKSLGLSFIELNMNLPEYQPNRIDVDKLKYLKDRNKIFYTIHLPEEFDIGNFNDDIKSAYEKIFNDTVMIAKSLNTPIINMHMNMGVYFTMPKEKIHLHKKYLKEYIDNINRFGIYSYDLLKNNDICLCIENTGIYDLDYIIKALDILLNNDNVFLTWDIGHDHASGNKDLKYISDNIGKLRHMHFHDAYGNKDHLPLFTGDIDIYEKINIAKEYGAYCVIETKTVRGLKESVENLFKRGVYK